MGFFLGFKIVARNYRRFFLKTKKGRLYGILLFLPVLIVFIKQIFSGFQQQTDQFWPQIILGLYFTILLPIAALLVATSIIAEEIEDKTLTYILTSPLNKKAFLAGKFFIYLLYLILMTLLSIFLSSLINFQAVMFSSFQLKIILRVMFAALLAITAYGGLFLAMSALNPRRAVVIGFIYIFGWESIVQYMPGLTQKFTLAHYVKSLLPYSLDNKAGGLKSFLFFELTPTPFWQSLLTLLLLAAIFIILALLIFNKKEITLGEGD